MEIDQTRLQHLLTRIRKQVTGEHRSMIGDAQNRFDELLRRCVTALILQEFNITDNTLQEIVEVVRHPSSQLTYGFELLSMTDLGLKSALDADVPNR
jgi:hypothetical protein